MPDQRKKVLCVDDEIDIPLRMKQFIERLYPIDVVVAGDGIEAMRILASENFDAVFLDVGMPKLSGLDVAAEIIKTYPNIVTVIITGSGDYEALAKNQGARFLVKPVSIAEIKHLIYQIFEFI